MNGLLAALGEDDPKVMAIMAQDASAAVKRSMLVELLQGRQPVAPTPLPKEVSIKPTRRPSAYSLIPPDRPATEKEALALYGPVINFWTARARPDCLRGWDDIRQDARLGVIHAWRKWDPAKAKGGTFKSWVGFNVKQWVFSKGVKNFGLNLQNARRQGNLGERLAVLNPMGLEDLRFGTDKRYSNDGGESPAFRDPEAEAAFDLSGIDFDALVAMAPNERAGICLREYYLRGRSLEDIGLELGITKERVRQIMETSYGRIRQALSMRSLKARAATIVGADNVVPGDVPVVSISMPQPRTSSPLPVTVNTNMARLAEIIGVSKRTVYRWVNDHGIEEVVKVCNDILSEFEAVVRPVDLAKKLGVSRSTIYRLIAERKLVGLDFFRGTIRIPLSEVRRIYREAAERGVKDVMPMTDKELANLFSAKDGNGDKEGQNEGP